MRPVVLAPNDGTLAVETRYGPMTATGVGALRWRDGRFAGSTAALIEEGGVNHNPNPFFVGISAAIWGGVMFSVDATIPAVPWLRTALHVDGRFYTLGGMNVPFPAPGLGNAVTVSGYFRHMAISGRSDLATRIDFATTGSDSALSLPFGVPRDDMWHYRAATRVATSEGDLGLIRIYIHGYPNGDDGVWENTAVQVELKDHATTPCPEFDASGNLLPGYAWTGAANASPSTRAETELRLPYGGPIGSVACWYSEDLGATWQWHYAETLGAIGTYGHIAQVGGELVITSDRALLLGPLAAWADPLTPDEQAGVQAVDRVWTRGDVGWPALPIYTRVGGTLLAAERWAIRRDGALVDVTATLG